MGLKLVDPVVLKGYFTTLPNTILTFKRDFRIEKASVDEEGNTTLYRLRSTMYLYTPEAYAKITVGSPDLAEHIFAEEQVFEISPEILDTNLSTYLYSKMLELYPTAQSC